ncbi:MAG TPA: hypothetical protein VNZ05_03995 [Solirubrobacteraceae bacterium]|jgi:hypothetical protein|nr:hypothetical protein [Solirubrobacteraceae bacterium]
MSNPVHKSPPADVCLLLRAHAEARWLSREMVPVIRELERDGNAHAGLASYLQTLRVEARRHAAETDAVRIELDAAPPAGEHELHYDARRYHAAVRRLRATIERRLQPLLGDALEPPVSLEGHRRATQARSVAPRRAAPTGRARPRPKVLAEAPDLPAA